MTTSPIPEAILAALPPVAYDKFLTDSGASPTTGWRWRKRGWLRTINICGRHYITAEALTDFNRRAAAGEFATEIRNPRGSRAASIQPPPA
jgi:hypothetical protein